MKFLFSLMALIPFSLQAKLVNIYYESDRKLAVQLKQQVFELQKIPSDYITIQKGGCRTHVDKSFWNLCLNKEKELIELPSNYRFITKSIRTFKIP